MGFLEKCKQTGEAILEFGDVLVVHHYDCDGLASAAIICSAADTRKTVSAKKIDDGLVKKINSIEKDCTVFADIGSSQRILLEEKAEGELFFIDHHPPRKKGGNQANVHDYGFDGSTDACGASTAYHCFKHTGKDLGRLGITGAVGDMQAPFTGFNKVMLDECVARGEVLVVPGLVIPGRITEPLGELLESVPEGFDSSKHYYDLNAKNRMRLDAELRKTMSEKSFGDAYVFPSQPGREETRDAHELSALLNACGRSGHAKKGIDAAISGGERLAEARRLTREHEERLDELTRNAQKVDLGAFDYYDGRGKAGATEVGVITSRLVGSKPIIGFAREENGVKVSARGTPELVEKGLDLGEAMRKAAEAAGGTGGGHNVAAGAGFPKGGEERFLKKTREVIEIQLELRKV